VVELGNTLTKAEPTATATEAMGQDLVNKVNDIKSKMDSPLLSVVQGCVEGAVKSQLTKDKADEQEIQRRKTSVIAHGISELDADSASERNDNDIVRRNLL